MTDSNSKKIKISTIKRLFCAVILLLLFISPALAKTDRLSEDYLKNKHHLAIANPVAEKIAERVIKKAIKKETKGHYKVKLEGYTLSSMKKGIFKYLEINSKNICVEDIEIPYMNMKTITDYNWIDYTKNPIEFRSDITFNYEMHLTEETINSALKTKDYQKTLNKVNKIAYPLFCLTDIKVRIKNNRLHIIMEYNSPVLPAKKNRTFMVSGDLSVSNGRTKITHIGFDNAYGNLPLNKVVNLVNLIDPLSFTLDLIDNKKCTGRIEDIKIQENIIIINGKIFIKKEV